jgi:hypothetical protein
MMCSETLPDSYLSLTSSLGSAPTSAFDARIRNNFQDFYPSQLSPLKLLSAFSSMLRVRCCRGSPDIGALLRQQNHGYERPDTSYSPLVQLTVRAKLVKEKVAGTHGRGCHTHDLASAYRCAKGIWHLSAVSAANRPGLWLLLTSDPGCPKGDWTLHVDPERSIL